MDEIDSVIDKMIENREQQIINCERMLELLQPEWDLFENRAKDDPPHNVYIARDYADHTSSLRTARKELEALKAVRNRIMEPRHG